jgi:MinD superfamily P-loop ATPase
MRSIVVLSGKGGVGKSSITASLAVALAKTHKIVCADCDVDASNLSLLFGKKPEDFLEWESISTNQIAMIDHSRCINCGRCAKACYFDAISMGKMPVIDRFGCEGCGACKIACPVSAIRLEDIDNAHVGYAQTDFGFKVASAQLYPGCSGSGKIVAKVKEKAEEIAGDAELLLIDSAAGIGCPVIASVAGSDLAVIVAEPTPSSFSDMTRAIRIVDNFRTRKVIIINKYDMNPDWTEKIEAFARKNDIAIVQKLAFDKAFVKSMIEMVPIIHTRKEYEKIFEDIKMNVVKEVNR